MRRGWFGGLLIGLLFFISGFTGLVYEVVWAKYLALLLGSTAYAQVGVLAVFMGGLALGSAIWGRAADRGTHALRLYGLLELGVGVSAALFAWGFDALSHVYWSVLAAAGGTETAAVLIKTGLCIVAMLAPTICMGGTLPVLSRALNLRRAGFGRGVAYLYGINSLGAATGSVAAGFYLVPEWGFEVPFYGAALLNIAVGFLALGLDRRTQPADTEAETASVQAVAASEPVEVVGYAALVPAAAAISGAVAMIYEVAWIRLCSLVLGSSTYSFSIMLTAFILGIAAGGLVYSIFNPARGRPLRFYAFTSLLSVVLVLACLPYYDRLPFYAARAIGLLRQEHVSFAWFQAATLAFCVVVMLPLTFMSGLNFPALAHAAAQRMAGVGRPVASVLVANTAGTIVGTVLGGLYLLPSRGLEGTFLLCCMLTLLTVFVVLLCDRSLPRWQLLAVVGGVALGLPAYLWLVPGWDLRLLSLGEFRRHEGIADKDFATYYSGVQHKLLYYRDGASATVSVDQWPEDVVLRVNGKADASANGDRETQQLLAHIPAVMHPNAKHALIIGYGSGMTAGALLRHPLESVDVVEISPEVMATDRFFAPFNNAPLSDPRTHVYIEDARTFLYRTPQRYDLIISEPSNPWIAGVGNLFTSEFFEQVKGRLTEDGVFVQWFHTYETSDQVLLLILRTVANAFAEVRAFQPNQWDVIVVASPSRRQEVSPAAQAAFARASDLAQIDLKCLSTLLALEILPDSLARKALGGGVLNQDRFPALEYAAPRAFHDGRSSGLLANAKTVGTTDYLQPADALKVDDLRDLATYLRRFEMLPYYNTLRFFSVWFRHAPMDPPLHDAVAAWLVERPHSPLLFSELTAVAQSMPEAERPAYARAMLQMLAKVPPPPTLEQVRICEPLLRDAARISGDSELLRELASWYVMAQANDEALALVDQTLADPRVAASGEQSTALQCVRGLALERLQRLDAARVAYAACAASPTERMRQTGQAALQRLAAAR